MNVDGDKKKKQEEVSSFQLLPTELAFKIFDRLSLESKKESRLVCRRWQLIFDNSERYFSFRVDLNNANMKAFMQSHQSMDLVTMNNTNLKGPKPGTHLPKIKEGILGRKNSKKNIVIFLRICGEAEALTIVKFALSEISETAIKKTLADISWDNLSALKPFVSLTKKDNQQAKDHLKNSIIFMKLVKISNLKSFEFQFKHRYENRDFLKLKRDAKFTHVCQGLYDFLASHSESLKILSIFISMKRREAFKIPEIPLSLKTIISKNLSLESCTLKFWGVEAIEELVFPELFGSNLKSIGLFGIVPSNERRNPTSPPKANSTVFLAYLTQIFQSNEKSLRKITLSKLPSFTLIGLENCHQLENIIIELDYWVRIQWKEEKIIFEQILQNNCTYLRELSIPLCLKLSFLRKYLKLESLRTFIAREDMEGNYQNQLRLKKLKLSAFDSSHRNRMRSEIQDVINTSGDILDSLDLDVIGTYSLSPCYALKYLRIWYHREKLQEFFLNTSSLNFVHLAELQVCIDPENVAFTNFVLANMPNLEIIGRVEGFPIDLIERFLEMPKMKQVKLGPLSDRNSWAGMEAFVKENPGLTSKFPKKEDDDHFYYFTILVDKQIYNTQN